MESLVFNEDEQSFLDTRSLENFFYIIHGDIFNIPVLKDPVQDSLTLVEIERDEAVEVCGKWYDSTLLKAYLVYGDYRSPDGKPWTDTDLKSALNEMQLSFSPQHFSKHVVISIINVLTREIESVYDRMVQEIQSFERMERFTFVLDGLWKHLKLCVAGLTSYNLLKAYSLCRTLFKRIIALKSEIPVLQEPIEQVYEGLGNLCACVTNAILRAEGKGEMCKMISRTKRTSPAVRF